MAHPLSSVYISIFHQKSATFALLRNTDKDCILMHNFECINLFEPSKIVLIKMAAILMMPAKLAPLGLLKIKVT